MHYCRYMYLANNISYERERERAMLHEIPLFRWILLFYHLIYNYLINKITSESINLKTYILVFHKKSIQCWCFHALFDKEIKILYLWSTDTILPSGVSWWIRMPQTWAGLGGVSREIIVFNYIVSINMPIYWYQSCFPYVDVLWSLRIKSMKNIRSPELPSSWRTLW